MESFFNSERIMDEEELVIVHDLNHDHFHDHVSDSCSSSSSINGEDEDQEEDEDKEVNSSPLQDMSSLLLQLPIKRGLSKHYSGKSQSFTSLSNVKCVEDLAKPQNPFNKKLKACKSYGGGFVKKHTSSSKKVQLNLRPSQLFYGRRNSTFFNNNNKPPIHPPQVA